MTLRELTASSRSDVFDGLAGAPELGRILWRAVYANHDPSARQVIEALCELCVEKHGWAATEQLWLLAGMAYREWSEPLCAECQGRRELIGRQLRMQCATCRGTGLRRYSNRERRRRMGEWSPRLTARVQTMLRILTDVDTATARVVGKRLRPLTDASDIRHHPPADHRVTDSAVVQFGNAELAT